MGFNKYEKMWWLAQCEKMKLYVTICEISIPVASRVGAEMFIEGQISSLLLTT